MRHLNINKFKDLFEKGYNKKELMKEFKTSLYVINRYLLELNLDLNKRQNKFHLKKFPTEEIGKKYSNLTIVDYKYDEKYKIWKAIVQCDCGNVAESKLSFLKKGNRKTCGKENCPFLNKIRIKNGRWNFTGYEEIYGMKWAQWRIGAEKRNLEFKISIEYAWDLFIKQNRKCAISGVDIIFGNSWNKKITASLDRIDSSLGYIEGNVQWVHKKINSMKGDMKNEEFKEWCDKISSYKRTSIV